MRNIFLVMALVISMATQAQVTKVYLQASGLTCSMCSNAIDKALKSLDFINKVDADIKNYTFEISFKPGSKVDFDKIKNKVEGAGFFVADFIATINFDNVPVKEGQPVTIGNCTLLFVNPKEQLLNGTKPVRVLDKGFISARKNKRDAFPASLTQQGIYHVTL